MTLNLFNKKYRKTKKSQKGFGLVFVSAICIIIVLLVINFADIISSMISSSTSIFTGGKIRVPSVTLYAVSMGQYSDSEQAQMSASKITEQGGAGYVYHMGDYFVFAAMYDSIVDANSVIEKLKSDKVVADIVNINIPAVNISYKGKSEKTILQCVEHFRHCYKTLYDIAISYDGGELTTAQAKDQIATLLSETKQSIARLGDVIKKEPLQHLILLENKLMNVLLTLQNLHNFEVQRLNFNSSIKYSYFKVVFYNIDYAKQV